MATTRGPVNIRLGLILPRLIVKEGNLITFEKTWLLKADIAWTTPKTYEVTIDFDSGEAKQGLILDVGTLPNLQITRDDMSVTQPLPTTLPVGKYRVVIKGNFP
jgi:hypothetical protein